MSKMRPAKAASELEALQQRAGTHLVQPWPTAGKIGTEHLGMVGEGDGIFITDESGRRLIDGPAGMWCVNVGHRRAELADAMRDQAMALSYSSPWYTTSEPSLRLAERLAGHAPKGLDHVFLTTGGTSAVETALRLMFFINLVKGRPEKRMIVTRDRAYHGSSYLTGSLNGRPRDQDWMTAAQDQVIRLTCPDPLHRPAGMSVEGFTDFLVEQFRLAIETHGAEHIGAFIAEPIMASGGVVVPPPDYLKRMRALCRANDILFIADEVVTAFGRLGEVFSSDSVFGIEPDMITFAKGVTSGYFPLGGVMLSSALLEELRALEPSAGDLRAWPDLFQPSDRLRRGAAQSRSARGRAACPCPRGLGVFPDLPEGARGHTAGWRGARHGPDGLHRMRGGPRQPQPLGAGP